MARSPWPSVSSFALYRVLLHYEIEYDGLQALYRMRLVALWHINCRQLLRG